MSNPVVKLFRRLNALITCHVIALPRLNVGCVSQCIDIDEGEAGVKYEHHRAVSVCDTESVVKEERHEPALAQRRTCVAAARALRCQLVCFAARYDATHSPWTSRHIRLSGTVKRRCI